MIKGHVTGKVNARSEPTSNTSDITNVVRQLLNGQLFVGSLFKKDSLGRDWIKIIEIEGVPITSEMYVATFISSVVVDEIVPDVPDTGLENKIPTRITTIEEFVMVDGTIKKRTIVWDNPQVTEG